MKLVKVTSQKSNVNPLVLKSCNSFWNKFLGLMFLQNLEQDSGVVFVESSESRLNTSIHMLFMNFDITVLWLDRNYRVVDKSIAKKWRLAYFPSLPAQYVVETNTNRFDDFNIGDQLLFEYAK